jgi:hypothetical protein
MGLRVVESHFSQSTREMGHPGKCNVKGSGRGRPLYFKIKVKSNGQECPFHTS